LQVDFNRVAYPVEYCVGVAQHLSPVGSCQMPHSLHPAETFALGVVQHYAQPTAFSVVEGKHLIDIIGGQKDPAHCFSRGALDFRSKRYPAAILDDQVKSNPIWHEHALFAEVSIKARSNSLSQVFDLGKFNERVRARLSVCREKIKVVNRFDDRKGLAVQPVYGLSSSNKTSNRFT
jgi:hypothetical protein